jgi:hypothetical protein
VPTPVEQDKPKNTFRYFSWSELLRRTFGFEIVCQKCQSPLRLSALIKTEDIAKKILSLCRARHKVRYVEYQIMWSWGKVTTASSTVVVEVVRQCGST